MAPGGAPCCPTRHRGDWASRSGKAGGELKGQARGASPVSCLEKASDYPRCSGRWSTLLPGRPCCLGEGSWEGIVVFSCRGLMALSHFCCHFQQGHALGLLCHPARTVDPVPQLTAETHSLCAGRNRSQQSVWHQGGRQPPAWFHSFPGGTGSALTKQPVMLPPERLREELARHSSPSVSSTEGQEAAAYLFQPPEPQDVAL